ncbi:cathepsin L-like, partial [Palaemon carinicauda]|uniref:cathepsin L-like n=1 Tax=Palaemon carinicauda TaxID=392227 RepID=UPI0035B66D65
HLIGGDDHDRVAHTKPLLGGDDHDRVPHTKHLLGGDDHDRVAHTKPLLGGDDHDRVPHTKHLIGGDDHDRVPHTKHLLGGDDHDRVAHTKRVLGGDDHDRVSHTKHLIGGDDHDRVPHTKHLLGGDDHDRVAHTKRVLGGDDHDRVSHTKRVLGGDDHDRVPHSKRLLGGDDHDRVPHTKKVFGGGGHDLGHMGAFKSFMKEHAKVYADHAEFKRRFNIFRQNMKKVYILQQNERGTAKYGATKFADLTETEFRRRLGLRQDKKPVVSKMVPAEIPDIDVPLEFDWREKGAVTPVKNQGECGSCWAFSVTGNVEGQWAIKHDKLISLSEQELVDCDSTDEGCNGGMPENAYEAIKKLGGLETETDYPYEGRDEKCHFDKSMVKVTVNGSVELPQDETMLAKWLVKNGPISIGINANALQFYVGGVSHPWKFLCNPENLDHGMLIVGYGVHTTKYLHKKQPYWIVKNSWGSNWGEQGYYRVYRGDGTCGVNQMATSAIVP